MNYDYDDEEEIPVPAESIPTPTGITITVPNYALDNIASSAVNHISAVLKDKVMTLVTAKIDEIVAGAFGDAIEARATAAIEAYLTTPRPKTNAFGEKIGEGQSIGETVPRLVKEWMEEKLASNGNPCDNYGSRDGVPRHFWYVKKYVGETLASEVKAATDRVTNEAKKAVAASVGQFIANQLMPTVEVPKLGELK